MWASFVYCMHGCHYLMVYQFKPSVAISFGFFVAMDNAWSWLCGANLLRYKVSSLRLYTFQHVMRKSSISVVVFFTCL